MWCLGADWLQGLIPQRELWLWLAVTGQQQREREKIWGQTIRMQRGWALGVTGRDVGRWANKGEVEESVSRARERTGQGQKWQRINRKHNVSAWLLISGLDCTAREYFWAPLAARVCHPPPLAFPQRTMAGYSSYVWTVVVPVLSSAAGLSEDTSGPFWRKHWCLKQHLQVLKINSMRGSD